MQILEPETVALMMSAHLGDNDLLAEFEEGVTVSGFRGREGDLG